jgi:hypothetical protein
MKWLASAGGAFYRVRRKSEGGFVGRNPQKVALLLGEVRFSTIFAVVRAGFDIASNFRAHKSVIDFYFCCFR